MTNNAYRKTYIQQFYPHISYSTHAVKLSLIIIRLKPIKKRPLKLTEVVVLVSHHAVASITVTVTGTREWPCMLTEMKEELKKQRCNGKNRFIKNKTKREPSRALSESSLPQSSKACFRNTTSNKDKEKQSTDRTPSSQTKEEARYHPPFNRSERTKPFLHECKTTQRK